MDQLRKISENDVLEICEYEYQNRPHILHYDRQVQDQRAKLVFSFIQSWGIAAAFSDVMYDLHTPEEGSRAQKPARIPATELVMRACEIVDAAWCELKHRGWILDIPPSGSFYD